MDSRYLKVNLNFINPINVSINDEPERVKIVINDPFIFVSSAQNIPI